MVDKSLFNCVVLTEDMIAKAKELESDVRVNRTIASKIDTLTGILGEFAFAEWFYDDWHLNRVGENKGDVNFKDIEIKTSSFPFNHKLNLLVREDYALSRKPSFYIQIIIDVSSTKAHTIEPNTKAYICGYATADEVDNAPLRDFGSKFGRPGGYKCHYINILLLHPMSDFRNAYNNLNEKV